MHTLNYVPLCGTSVLRRLISPTFSISVSLIRKGVHLGGFEMSFPAFECCLVCVLVVFCVTDGLKSSRYALVIRAVLVVFVLATH